MNKKTYYAILDDVHTQLTSNYTDLYTLIENNKTTIIQYQATYLVINNPSEMIKEIKLDISDILGEISEDVEADAIVDAILNKHEEIFNLFNL